MFGFGITEVGAIMLCLVGLIFYFIPTMIATKRGHINEEQVFLLNLFLGWTFLGWLATLIWACTGECSENKIGTKKCPYCAEYVKNEAIVCRFCGGNLEDIIKKE